MPEPKYIWKAERWTFSWSTRPVEKCEVVSRGSKAVEVRIPSEGNRISVCSIYGSDVMFFDSFQEAKDWVVAETKKLANAIEARHKQIMGRLRMVECLEDPDNKKKEMPI